MGEIYRKTLSLLLWEVHINLEVEKLDFYRRLSYDQPSPTVVTSPVQKATMMCHPTQDRPLSVKEYARIQQFPDDWVFTGTTAAKYWQIGNAVPVGLAEAIGKATLETFYGTLIEKIDGLNIQKVMKRKNPYLYRAKAMQSAAEIVDSVLTAFVSSSEETIFGNFTAASKLEQQAKARYEAYIGYCYGKKKDSGRGKPKMYQELAGKRFWAYFTHG